MEVPKILFASIALYLKQTNKEKKLHETVVPPPPPPGGAPLQCQGLTTDGIGPGGYIGTVHLYSVGWCNVMVIVVHRSDNESGHSVVIVRYIVV